MKNIFLIIFIFLHINSTCFAQSPIIIRKFSTSHGPENGKLLIIGGGNISPEVWQKFTDMAGGKEHSKVVVIPTASSDSITDLETPSEMIRKNTGIKNVISIHTKDLNIANSDAFIAPLKDATAVFFVGGRQWRIADSYLNTKTHQAFNDVLERGGLIAGSSAGATIQGSFLWRGDTSGPEILIGDHTQGLSFLRNSVIDQHLLKRNRQFDLVEFIKISPKLIGIGIDESTGIVVERDVFEVVGKSYVAVYDYNTIHNYQKTKKTDTLEDYSKSRGSFFLLSSGQKYDMKKREIIKQE